MESDPYTSTVQTRIRNEEIVFDINNPSPNSLMGDGQGDILGMSCSL